MLLRNNLHCQIRIFVRLNYFSISTSSTLGTESESRISVEETIADSPVFSPSLLTELNWNPRQIDQGSLKERERERETFNCLRVALGPLFVFVSFLVPLDGAYLLMTTCSWELCELNRGAQRTTTEQCRTDTTRVYPTESSSLLCCAVHFWVKSFREEVEEKRFLQPCSIVWRLQRFLLKVEEETACLAELAEQQQLIARQQVRQEASWKFFLFLHFASIKARVFLASI